MELAELFTYNSIVLILCLLLILLIYNKIKNINKKSPPGPWNLPIVGYLPFLGTRPHLTFTKLAAKYGNVFQIHLGSHTVIVLNGFETLNEALDGNTASHFASRPNIFINTIFRKAGKGIFFENYDEDLKIRRHLLLQAINILTNPKSSFQETVTNAAQNLVKTLVIKGKEGPFYPGDDIGSAVGRVISSLCFGSNFAEFETAYSKIMENFVRFAEFAGTGNKVNFLPWLRFIFSKKVNDYISYNASFQEMCRNLIKKKMENVKSAEHTDIIEALILARKEMESAGEPMMKFSERDYAIIAQELLGGGFNTISNTLRWAIFFMTIYQDNQKEVQDEIDSVLKGKIPTFNDRNNLPLIEATILEVHRYGSFSVMGVPRSATEDVMFRDYFIPKGTVVMTNIYSAFRDEKIWKEPYKFNPHRFLNSSRNGINQELAAKVIPFGLGRRRCLGEKIGGMELYLFFTTIMQHCNFKAAKGHELDPENYTFGLGIMLNPFMISITPRK